MTEMKNIVVVGMGYVGIPCAALLADVDGFNVIGVQRRSKRSGWKIDCLNRGDCPFSGDEPGLAELIRRVVVEKGTFRVTDDLSVCKDADVILIDVQTPTDSNRIPQYVSLREVSAGVGKCLSKDTLVIIESTVAPGTTQNIVQPILEEESGLKAGEDFYLAFSYEKLVLDDEMCGMLRRFHQGFAVDEGTLAYDVIANVGPGGNYLMEMHTVQRCREEFWKPALCDRAGLEAWMQGGRVDAVHRARERWQKLVAEHEDPPLEATTARQLQDYVEAKVKVKVKAKVKEKPVLQFTN